MSNYQLVNGIALFVIVFYGIIDRLVSEGKYTSFELGIFNLIFTFCVFYFLCQIIK
jgi:hypothetical protein